MTGPDLRGALLGFLETVRRPECSLADVGDDVDLFDAGIVDSLAVVRIVMYLEESHGIDLVEAGVDPADLASIGRILDVIERSAS